MAVLPILKYPDPSLKHVSAPVETITDDIRQLAQDMVETMYNAHGSGLAAPQVGKNCRMIVVDAGTPEESGKPLVLINPEILSAQGEIIFEEACLSVIDYSANVHRAAEITVQGLDPDGRSIEYKAIGRMAVVFQHEIDHLNGVLFIDRISSLRRDLYRRKLKKLIKNSSAAA
ncbi:MAG: peptide deformylase [Deltaproteobacteria bacterium]|nr:peptide deformylase [Deltaproteobacteria bacterium]